MHKQVGEVLIPDPQMEADETRHKAAAVLKQFVGLSHKQNKEELLWLIFYFFFLDNFDFPLTIL